MKKRARRFLSVLLALTMILSHADLSFAKETGGESSPAAESVSNGRELKLIPVDPAELSVKKLGEGEEAGSDQQADVLPYALDDIVRVSIFLEAPGAYDAGYKLQGIGTNSAAVSYQETLRRNQKSMQTKIEAAIGRSIEVKWNLTLLTNAISANVRYGDLDAIRAIQGVKSVELEQQYAPAETESSGTAEPLMTNARDMVGANSGNATKYQGAGSKLAIIDTGLDVDHQSFDADAFNKAIAEDEEESGLTYDLLTEDEVNALKSTLNGKNGIYLSSKIPFTYNYVDNSTNVTHINDQQGEHGSHVAGIATANRYIKSGSEYVEAADTVKVVGEAPDAQIFVMKVFGAGGGAYDSDYMSAVEDAVRLGASSANLSLGSGQPGIATQTQSTYMAILNNLETSELVLSVSMGNNTSWDSQKQLYADDVNLMTGGSPGSFNNSFTVASVDDSGTAIPLIHFGNISSRYDEMSGGNKKTLPEIAGTYEFIYLDDIGYTDGNGSSPSDYNERYSQFHTLGGIVEGKVALCNRGSSSFFLKAMAAMDAGAAALIVVNNQPGSMSSTSCEGYSGTNPVVGIKQSVGAEIRAAYEMQTAEGLNYYIGTIVIDGTENATPLEYYEMSDFSSWGVTGALTLKPEITAPGGSVLSLNGYHQSETQRNVFEGGHDQYELMSGTSMAAPQITGLSAAVGQYYRDNGIAEKTGLSARHFALSELMATAVPLKEESSANYYSLLKQGAGLANLEAVVDAKSFIKMDAEATLTADDYKVKAELGDDPSRSGVYTYSFEIHNFSDEDVEYSLRTDVFTQALSADKKLMEHTTATVDAAVSYVWGAENPFTADVNQDGTTDEADADAILAYVTGANDGTAYDLAAAEQDGAQGITSRDAYALLEKLAASAEETHIVRAGAFRTITVTIRLTDAQKAEFDAEREGGAYVEAFTFIESEDDVTYSIPVLAFYGSWTDASMFDAVRYEEYFYGTDQTTYFLSAANAANTNLWNLRYNGSGTDTKYTGNPYVKEDVFPADRLALNSSTVLYQARYNLIRPAAGVAFAAIKEDGTILYAGSPASTQNAAYYNTQSSTPSWQSTGTSTNNANRAVSALGVSEGDKFTFGLFAFPEYYTYQVNGSDQTFALTSAQFQKILQDGNYGKGAYIGYTVTVDDTAPVIEEAAVNDDGTVTVTISENQYVADLRVMDVSGRKTYVNIVPEQSAAGETITYTFDPAEYNLGNACTVFAADYAGNESAAVVRIGEGDIIVEKALYRLTDTLEAGKNYLIVNANTAGSTTRYALGHSGTSAARDDVIISSDDEGIFIDGANVDSTSVWTAGGEYVFTNDGSYLRVISSGSGWGATTSISVDGTDSQNVWTWDAANHRLSTRFNNRDYYLRYSNNAFGVSTSTNNSSVYLYVEETYTEIIDPSAVSSVTVTPETLSLYKGNTAKLIAEVLPVTAADKAVVWSSSNEEVATVDEEGTVTAVGGGTATITAAAHSDSTKFAECAVTVTDRAVINGTVNAQLVDGNGANFVRIDLNDLSTEILGAAAATHYGGGRSDNVILGFTSSRQGEVVLTEIDDDVYSSAVLGTFGTSTYNMKDGAHIPTVSAVVDDKLYEEEYLSIYFAAQYLLMFTPDYGITGWQGISNYAAIAYVGTDETGAHYYYALNGSGQLEPMAIGVDEEEPIVVDEEDGTESLSLTLGRGDPFAISGLNFNTNYMSMSILDNEEYYGLLIANTNNQQIYFVDLTQDTLTAVLVAGFTGATSLTTLYNDEYDTSVVGLNANRTGTIERMKADIASSGIGALKSQKIASLVKEDAEVTEEVTEAPAEEAAEAAEEVTEAAEEEVEEAVEEVTEAPEEEAEEAAEEVTEAAEEEAEEAAEEVTEAAEEEAEEAAEEAAEEVTEAPEEEAEEEIAEEEGENEEAEPVSQIVGGLNAIRAKAYITGRGDAVLPLAVSGTSEQGEDDSVTVSLTEDTAVTNGYISISFDADLLTYVKAESSLAHYSVNRNENTIVFAYANLSEIAAGTELLKLTFETDCTGGTDRVLEVNTRERNEDLALNEEAEVNVPAGPHDWAVSWTWNGEDPNYTSATASFVCNNDPTHTDELTDSDLEFTVTLEPTADSTDTGIFTAVVTKDGKDYSDTKEVTIPKLGRHIIVENHVGTFAETSLDADTLYSGEVSFTATCALVLDDETIDAGCVLAIKNADGTYTKLTCTTEDGVHTFTVTVGDEDITLVMVMKGDANLDGEIDIADLSFIKQQITEKRELTALQLLGANACEDDEIDVADLSFVKQIMTHKKVLTW